ncbi:hypothetical protein CDAR_171751 [Caerostris darwini]|uniref:Secreted protein n=1 Tax=Caerostris darwini TaxID=1538125 RepID=A0AAV4N703_9ARAC|nr:hypothetical protein CDAR_171751 [Caerostris darwini]
MTPECFLCVNKFLFIFRLIFLLIRTKLSSSGAIFSQAVLSTELIAPEGRAAGFPANEISDTIRPRMVLVLFHNTRTCCDEVSAWYAVRVRVGRLLACHVDRDDKMNIFPFHEIIIGS